MRDSAAVSVIIPAYEEELRLRRTLLEMVEYFRCRETSAEMIVVDDGSRDGTSAVVHSLSRRYAELRLIRLAQNHGKGYAVRTGVVNARGACVLVADADGATPIAEIERLERALEEGSDVAVGSRASVPGADVRVQRRWYRHVMGRTFHGLVELLTVKGIRDTQCGFKLFRGSIAHDLFSRMRMEGFSFDVELLLMAQRRGYRVAEVPINWVHQPGSKIRVVRDSIRMAADLVAIRTNCLKGEYDRPRITPYDDAAESVLETP
ncbi:MAG TPA: dolichyl-phosphate beta-glucosyltransferase [Gemmatimonadales bacterium]|jgi:dolichyl-phosphate beta-glucosyltransferase|nr:dolichyl-phosphate beta-glucosyltransferase [Gemmatimonadales bacterium]